MPYAKINKSGCYERHGNLQIRFDFFLEEEDPRYSDTYIQVPDIPKETEVPENAADEWADQFPKKWQLSPFHSHFVYFGPDVTDEEIRAEMNFHLPNFYLAFQNEWDKEPGGMRHGWAKEKRKRPVRYSNTLKAVEYDQLRLQCLERLNLLTEISSKTDIQGGKEYPSTDIDVGLDPTADGGQFNAETTGINLFNPANDTGSLDTIELYPRDTNITGFKAGTFYAGDYPDFTNRDYANLGAAAIGDKRTFTGLDINVTLGDLIGIYFAVGVMYNLLTGSSGIHWKAGDQFDAGTQSYGIAGGDCLQLYGTGETEPPPGPTFKHIPHCGPRKKRTQFFPTLGM